MSSAQAKDYLQEQHIPRLFESLLTGLMYYRPEDPINYLELCLQRVRNLGGPEKVQWDTFLGQNLPPIYGNQGKKCKQKSEGTHTHRYERLPPTQSQFSIDSDSDMTESSGLIQEYDVFDPNRPRPKVIFVIGGPGSGKGTQSTKMASHFGFICISVGEILRKQLIHHATSDRKWELIAQIISKGELAPPETTIEELKQQFINHQDATGFVVDGFPRDIGQAFTFEEQIGTPDLVIFLACSSQRLRQRLERRSAQQGRPDDNAHAIDRRVETFKQNLPLIVKYYQDKGLIARFDADREENCIFEDICCAVQGLLFPDGLGVKEFCPQNLCAALSDDPAQPREMEGKEQYPFNFPIEVRRKARGDIVLSGDILPVALRRKYFLPPTGNMESVPATQEPGQVSAAPRPHIDHYNCLCNFNLMGSELSKLTYMNINQYSAGHPAVHTP
ncbi:adenylate kinase isoenzyme 1 isoform X2 [Hyla sarda]|uniref:adenylate kinase isoenzyme 1 isoform X2 n=1 Tax=Hyla sarda TaxID=327740 RepID=UPI0024C26D60|nr:adenylate kinase isoenzyme 1 isoform X2 [Hyla sarda]